jgi:Fic family protein
MIFQTPRLDPREEKVLSDIRELWKTLKYRLVTRPTRWGGWFRRSLFARALRGSNSIEGYVVSPDDAMAAAEGDEPFDTDLRNESWLAVSQYRDAMTYVLKLSEDPSFEYHGSLLRSLHYMMTRHDLRRAGVWRQGPIYVQDERGSEPRVVYEGPPAERVPPLMDELIAWLRSDDGSSPMIRAAMAHLNLVMIHPFGDGNGRMGRCLQTLVLARAGVLDPAFCSVEEYLGRETDAYYNVCSVVGGGSWQPERDARPWVRLMLKAHFQQATRVLRREAEAGKVFEEIEKLIQGEAFRERAVTSLVNAAFGYKLRNSSYRAAEGEDVSQLTASRDLKALSSLGLLEPAGQGRGRVYVASARLREIRERCRLNHDPFEGDESAPSIPRH